jgi:hypothetical protein
MRCRCCAPGGCFDSHGWRFANGCAANPKEGATVENENAEQRISALLANPLERAAMLAACLAHRAVELCNNPAVIFIAYQMNLVEVAKQIYGEKTGQQVQEAVARITAEASTKLSSA